MNKSIENRKALGKGLSALLPGRGSPKPASEPLQPQSSENIPAANAQGLTQVQVTDIEPNPVQPRSAFRSDKLEELAQSIRSNGIIQPLIVQRAKDKYQLVAGERRWRAAKLAGLTTVPVVVQEVVPTRLLEVALIENIQREDLNPIEVAQALEQLACEHNFSHEELAKRTGKDRTTVTNLLRLLKLSSEIQVLVAEHRLSMGHARAILGLPTTEQQLELAERVAAQGLSVRQTERLVQSVTAKRNNTPSKLETPTAKYNPKDDPNAAAATRELEAVLGTRVRVVAQSADRGKIEIEYYSFEELDRIYNQIIGSGGKT